MRPKHLCTENHNVSQLHIFCLLSSRLPKLFYTTQDTSENISTWYTLLEMGHMIILWRVKRYVFIQARDVTLWHASIQNLSAWNDWTNDVTKIVYFPTMRHLASVSTLPSTTPGVTLTTLLLRCQPYCTLPQPYFPPPLSISHYPIHLTSQ